MGALIKTGYDQQICNALITRFSDLPDPGAEAGNPDKTMLGSVRYQDLKESGLLFSRKLNLARLAHRLHTVPADAGAKLRWFFLLRRGLPHETKVAISAVLEAVMADTTIKQVYFDAVHDGTITTQFELDPKTRMFRKPRTCRAWLFPART